MPLISDAVQTAGCSAVLLQITNGSTYATPRLLVYDENNQLITTCNIGAFSSVVAGFTYASVVDAAITGIPHHYAIQNRAGSIVISGDMSEIPYTIIDNIFHVTGGLRIISPSVNICDDEMAFITEGATFSPEIEVTGTPTVLWTFADGTTSNILTPNINYGSAGTRVAKLKVTPWNAVASINLGYNGGDNGAAYTPADYYLADQRVSEIVNLHLVRESLIRFLASGEPGTPSLMRTVDFGGFSNLQVVEFFYGSMESVNLAGCAALIRMCFEQCHLTRLDATDLINLEDWRSAGNPFDSDNLIFASSYPALWHLCIQGSSNLTTLPAFNTTFPALQEAFIWSCSLSGSLGIGANNTELVNFQAQYNDFTQAELDNIAAQIAALNIVGNIFDIRGNAGQVSSAGYASIQEIIADGWSYVNFDLPTCATPQASPVEGTYSSTQYVTLTTETSGAEIRYTTDGTMPTGSSTLYTGAISISSTTTIRAIAIRSGYQNSAVLTAVYTISTQVAAPVFSPDGGSFSSQQSVTITCSTPASTIYYRIDGGSYQQYTGAITVSSTQTIDSYATASGLTNSSTVSRTFTINLATPSIEVTTTGSSLVMNFAVTSGTVSWTLDVNGSQVTGTGNINHNFGSSATRLSRVTFSDPAILTGINGFGNVDISLLKVNGGSSFPTFSIANYPSRVLDWDLGTASIGFAECGSDNTFHPYTEGLNSVIDAAVRSNATGSNLFFAPPPDGYSYANHTLLVTPVGSGGRGWNYYQYGGQCVPRP